MGKKNMSGNGSERKTKKCVCSLAREEQAGEKREGECRERSLKSNYL